MKPFALRDHFAKVVFFCVSALFVLLLLPSTAFASGGKEQSGAAASSGPTALNVIMGSWATDVLKPYFEKYDAKNNVKISYETYPYAELINTIQVRHASKSENIDVIFVDAPDVAEYAVGNYIIPLDKYFSKQFVDSTWAKPSSASGYWKGKFYAPPLNNSSQVLFYNADLLQKAGIPLPSTDTAKAWTWQQVSDAAKKVTDPKAGMWGFSFDQVNRYYQLQALPMSLGGGSGISADGKTAELTTKPWIDAFTWYSNLFNTWKVSPKGVPADQTPQLFSAGKVALFAGGLWNIPTFQKAGVKFGTAPYPYFAGGKQVSPMDSWHLGTWAYSHHKDQASALVKYLSSDTDLQISWLDGHGQFPALNAALQHIQDTAKYADQPYVGYRIAAWQAAHTAVPRPETPIYVQFEQTINSAFQDISNGAGVASALGQAQQKVDGFLNQFYSQNQ